MSEDFKYGFVDGYRTLEFMQLSYEKIVLCEPSDRNMYLKYVHGDLVGVNYMQGIIETDDEYDYFRGHFCFDDKELTDFVLTMLKVFGASDKNVEAIDDAIWVYVNCHLKYNAKK